MIDIDSIFDERQDPVRHGFSQTHTSASNRKTVGGCLCVEVIQRFGGNAANRCTQAAHPILSSDPRSDWHAGRTQSQPSVFTFQSCAQRWGRRRNLLPSNYALVQV